MTTLVVIFIVLWLFVAGLVLHQTVKASRARQFGAVAVCVGMAAILVFCLIAMVSVL